MQKEVDSKASQNTSCQTDLNAESFPFEKLPSFQLRVDETSDITEHNWIQTPVLSPEVKVDLSPEQCEETFKFFLLSGDRLSQMTRTYHDIDALMHLLEEKERDLELAARIGQTLLIRNRQVAEQNEMLEEKLTVALEESSQVRHELSKKEELLHIYTDDEFSATKEEVENLNTLQMRVSDLNVKINKLEKDKSSLMQEQFLVQSQTKESKEKQHKLVSNTVKQLSTLQNDLRMANSQILAVSDELNKRDADSYKQQDDISLLLKQILDLQSKHSQLVDEHEDLQQQLSVANDSQYELSQEVQTLESKYQDVLGMLDDTREEMRIFRDSNVPSEVDSTDYEFNHSWHNSVPYESSLAAELKGNEKLFDSISELDELVTDNEVMPNVLNNTYPSSSKAQHSIFKTVHFVNKRKESMDALPNVALSRSLPLSSQPSAHIPKWLAINATPSLESPNLGQPGIPGTTDLQRAIEKLTHFGKVGLNFVHQTRLQLQQAKQQEQTIMKKSPSAPKLQIVKPLEGSMTLHVWQSLANKGSVFPVLCKNPATSPSRIITRGNWLQQKGLQSNSGKSETVNVNKNTPSVDKNKNVDENTSRHQDVPTTSAIATSDEVAYAASREKLCQESVIGGSSGLYSSVVDPEKHRMKGVKSSPHLPSLAAALLPTTTSESIFHAVLRTSTPTAAKMNKPSSLDLSQLHGCDKQSSSKSSFS